MSLYLHCRLETGQDDVASLTPSYGAIDTNRSIPVAQTRARKYSESVGRSYVASAVARFSVNIFLVNNSLTLPVFTDQCPSPDRQDLLQPALELTVSEEILST